MFMRVTKVFLFTFSGLFNRQRIHNLFKNQMITNLAIQLNVCNSQCSLETCLLSLLKCPHGTCFHFCNAPLRPVCFHPHPHGTCFHFCNAPLGPGFHFSSVSRPVTASVSGISATGRLTQLNLRVKNRKHMKWNDMIFIFKNTQDCFLTMCNVKTRRKQSQTKTVF
jgi:hypothetical protein